jgi:hypothetical protein
MMVGGGILRCLTMDGRRGFAVRHLSAPFFLHRF